MENYKQKYEEVVKEISKLRDMLLEEGVIHIGGIIDDNFKRIFPELEESEDERIRKSLIDMLKNDEKCYLKEIAWLERQGEQKISDTDNKFIRMCETKPKDISEFLDRLTTVEQEFLWEHIAKIRELDKEEQKHTDKVEPKFKVGDWIVKGDVVAQILDVLEQYYIGIDTNGNDFTSSKFLSDDKIHLWTIKDAKDGDVLANDHHILILKELGYTWASNGKPECLYAYCGIKPDGNFELEKEHYCFCGILHTHPATKEQRDLLFQKMKEAGYEWDAEKKELRKIVIPIYNIGDRVRYKGHACDGVITKITDTDYICDNAVLPILTQDKLELVEQKPAWSEEDETYLNTIVSDLDYSKAIHNKAKCNFIDKEIKWFKSLKDRIQPKKEWSKEDEEIANKGVLILKSCAVGFPTDEKFANEFEIWIKSLKNRVQPQLKQEWSGEDEGYYDAIISKLEVTQEDALLTDNEMDFLKSLKDRVKPKQEWSEEDMEMIDLLIAIFEINYPNDVYKANPIGTTNMKGVCSCEIINWLKSLKDRVQPM